MGCDFATLLLAARLYVYEHTPTHFTNTVCGCNCITVESERLGCLAREAKELELQVDKIRAAIATCEETP